MYNFCRDKHVFVATNTYLSRQKYACRDKIMFVETKDLSRQIFDVFCRDEHVFVSVATKMRVTAAPANDSLQPNNPSP